MHFKLRLILPIICFAFICTLGCNRIGQPNVQGQISNSSTHEYFYDSGALCRRDFSQGDQVKRSQWFAPDGTQIAAVDFANGNGLEFYFDAKGELREIIPIRNYVAEGRGVAIREDLGSVEVSTFANGESVMKQTYMRLEREVKEDPAKLENEK